MHTRLLLALGLAAAASAPARGGEWPQFRGPGGTAVSAEGRLPAEWAVDKNVAWKVKLPGYGWSCPVVWGDKVFVTSSAADNQKKPSGGFGGGGFGGPGGPGGGRGRGGRRQAPDDIYRFQVFCLSAADGKVLWERTAVERKPPVPTHGSNTYATETPATDGERVVASFGPAGLFCYDLDGKQLWKADLGAYPLANGFGSGSSPALAGGRVFVQCDNEEKSFLAALDAKTGQELWRAARPERTGWSTPLVWSAGGRDEVVCVGSPRVRAYDPATGKQLWELDLGGQAKASPAAGGGLLYVGTGGRGGRPGRGGDGDGESAGGARPLVAVKPGASGDITPKAGGTAQAAVAWQVPSGGPPTASPLFYDGRLYVLEGRGGLVSCYDAATGKQLYKERIPGARGFTSSPWAYGGKVFCLDDGGTTHVLGAGPEFKVLARNKLDAMCWSSPAAAGGALYVRTVDHLYCIRDAAAGP